MEEYIFGIMPIPDKKLDNSEIIDHQKHELKKIIETEGWVWNYEKKSGILTYAIYNLPKTSYYELALSLNIKEYFIGQVDFINKRLYLKICTINDTENDLPIEKIHSIISINEEQLKRYITLFCLSNLKNKNYEQALSLSKFTEDKFFWSDKDNKENLNIIIDALKTIKKCENTYKKLCVLSILYKFDLGQSLSMQIKRYVEDIMLDCVNHNVHQCFYLICNFFNRDELSDFLTRILVEYKKIYKYPKAVSEIYEKYKVSASINAYEINAIKSNIKEFNIILDYLIYKVTSPNKRYSIKALLTYYLGDPVSSFKIYDEFLDNGDYVLTCQDLYYYCITSVLLDIETYSILESSLISCIKLVNKSACWENRYYLSLLYELCRKRNISCNNYNIEELLIDKDKLSLYFDIFRNDESIRANRRIIVYSKEEVIRLDWIDKYLRLYESAIFYNNTIITPEMWNFYSFDSCIADIENEIIEKISLATKDEISRAISKETEFPTSEINNWVKKQLLEIDPTRRRLYLDTKSGIDEGVNPENQIGLTISEFSAKDWKVYILLIYYFWINGKIEDSAVVSLCTYLTIKTKENRSYEFRNDALRITTAALLLTPFAATSTFYTLVANIMTLIRHKKRDIIHNYKDLSDYEICKLELFKQIGTLEKDSLSNLIKRLGFFSPVDKISQLKDFLENKDVKLKK